MHSTILLDPNWYESGGGKRGAQNHYELAKTHTMPRTILSSGAWDPHPDCHVYMWVTKNYLHNGDAHRLLWALGVRPITHFAWIKTKKPTKRKVLADAAMRRRARRTRFRTLDIPTRGGIGQYGRGSHELLLFGVMQGGSGPAFRSDRRDIQDVFFAPVTRHSAKPPEAYELIEARTLCPEGTTRMEFYARNARDGWSRWGNEAPPEEPIQASVASVDLEDEIW